MATLGNHISAIRLLLDRGADVSRDTFNQTALHKAARDNYTSAILLLLDRGANINAKDMRNHTTLGLARLRNHQETIDLLMEPSRSNRFTDRTIKKR